MAAVVDPEPNPAALRTLSSEMLELARADEWEQVAARDRQRRRLIAALFARPIPAALRAELEAAARHLHACDAELTALVRAQQRELARGLDALSAGRRARRAYAYCGPDLGPA